MKEQSQNWIDYNNTQETLIEKIVFLLAYLPVSAYVAIENLIRKAKANGK